MVVTISEEQLELYQSLFRGRTDVYARRWEKNGRTGYSPAYQFDWDKFLAHKRQGGTMATFEQKTAMPLTPDVTKKHLLGQQVIGIYPLLENNTSYFIAADFDGERAFDLQLDGNLSQAEYTAKKHKLILAKKDLEEKISAFGRKSNRLVPQ